MTTPADQATNAQECALWYRIFDAMNYDLYDSEAEAAYAAVVKDDSDYSVPVGVQFSDGRTVRVADWPAYQEAKRAYLAAERARRQAPQTRPTRQITDPFEGKPVTVDVDDPSWLGRP